MTALELTLRRGVDANAAVRRIRAVVRSSGLTAVTSAQMRAQVGATARADLANLRRIATLIAAAGLLAAVTTMLAGVLARLRRLTALRTLGMSLPQVTRSLGAETACVAGVGALAGALTGVVGHRLLVEYLATTVAAPVSFRLSPAQLAGAGALAAAAATLPALLPLRWIARVPLATSLRNVG